MQRYAVSSGLSIVLVKHCILQMIIRKLRVKTKHQTTIPAVAKIVLQVSVLKFHKFHKFLASKHPHIERIVWIVGKLGLL